MSFIGIHDLDLKIISLLSLEDIINLYTTNKYYRKLIKNIPLLMEILTMLVNLPDEEEDLILFIGDEFDDGNNTNYIDNINNILLVKKLIQHMNIHYPNYHGQYYNNFGEQVFYYLLGNEYVHDDNVNQFINIFDKNIVSYLNRWLNITYKNLNIITFFNMVYMLYNATDTKNSIYVKRTIKLFWLNNQHEIQKYLHPTGFFNTEYDDWYYQKIQKKYDKLNNILNA